MKKLVLLIAFVLVSTQIFAQAPEPKYEQKGDLVAVTTFYDNGNVMEQGFYNKEGKLHGVWIKFDEEGNKVVKAEYNNGKKVGKWSYWIDGEVREVDYSKKKLS